MGTKKLLSFIVSMGIIATMLAGCGDDSSNTTPVPEKKQEQKADTSTPAPATAKQEKKEATPQIPMEHRQALKAAEQYLTIMPFSKKGLYHQLTSEAGDKYPAEAAQYAVDNVKANWKENAARAAKQYLEIMPMSKDELVNQLTSEAGDQYTLEEAQYGVQKVYK